MLHQRPLTVRKWEPLCLGLALVLALATPSWGASPYPPSTVIRGVAWDMQTQVRLAPGSDLWPVTWANDGNFYTSWGDGGGFGGTNSSGRVTLGVARLSGTPENLTAVNVFGGSNGLTPATFDGKANGILSVGNVLYMSVVEQSAWLRAKIGKSTDHGLTWTFNSVNGWDFAEPDGAFSDMTFLNFGQNYTGARDNYVYVYSQDHRANSTSDGRTSDVAMFRVPKDRIMTRTAYEYFAGLDVSGNPKWTTNIKARAPVFSIPGGIGWGVRVDYNPGLKRYLLTNWHAWNGSWGIYDAPEPWGPWTTVVYYTNWLDNVAKFGFSFPQKWLSANGKKFVMVFSGQGQYDAWCTIRGTFLTGSDDTTPPSVPTGVSVTQTGP